MKKKTVPSLFLITLLAGLLSSGFNGNFNTALGNVIDGTNSNYDSWPMFHGDLTHSGYTASTGPLANQDKS